MIVIECSRNLKKMNDERIVEEIVTKFILNTCRLRPQPNKPNVEAAVRCAYIATRQPVNDEKADHIPLTAGSVAEFYIEPMLPCHVGDVDVMYHLSTQLAIPRGHPPPIQLPDEFNNDVSSRYMRLLTVSNRFIGILAHF